MVQYPFAWFRRTWPYASLFLLTAALGILSGLALFVFWWENSGKDGPLVVLGLALGVVTLTSFIFEKLRELVEAHKPHWSVRGVLGSIVTLAVFELFITAIHASVEAGPWKHVAIAKIIFGADFPFLASDGWNALALAGLWLVVGLAIGWQLMIIVRRCDLHPSSAARESIFGAAAGAFGAIIWGGLATVLYVLFWRSYSIADLARTNSSEWQYLVSPYTYFRVEHLFRWILCAPSILLLGWGTRHFGSAGFVAVALLCLLAAGYLASRHTVRWLAGLPLIGLFLVLIFPLVSSADARLQLWQLAKMTSVVWGIPAALLGALAPALRKPSEKPPYWGMIAFSAALVLAVAAALRLFHHEWRSAETWFLVLGVIVLLLAGLALAGGRSALELWPLVALSIGI